MNLALLLYDNRSGSTYFSALLNQYDGVEVLQETDVLSMLLEAPPSFFEGPTPRRAQWLLAGSRISEWGLSERDVALAIDGATSAPGMIRRLVEAASGAAEAVVVKDARLYYHLPRLWEAADAVLEIVRDGRAVFASKRRTISSFSQVSMDDNPVSAALKWKAKLSRSRRHSGDILTVRYEDLVTSTERTLERVFDHLGVSGAGRAQTKDLKAYSDQVAEAYRTVHPNIHQPPKSDRITAWKSSLPPRDLWVYEVVAGTTLARHGYQRETRALRGGAPDYLRLASALASYAWRTASSAVQYAGRGELLPKLRSKAFERFD